MGIQGLLPFLKKIHQPVNISDFKGCTVAVDAYCWLHKGAFSCAEKLAMGEKTDQYVYYCMKYIDYMLRKGLKPIMVFDGCHLQSKEGVEKERRARRELNRKKAAQFLREGKRSEAKECLQRCVDITPQMALNLMNVCRDRGVDCIVAPYEADAQLAYLNLSGIAQIVVTEDSDLLLFGCEKVIFKMDFFGNGVLIEKSRLNEVVAIQNSFYNFEKFRYMCILSGCDYLPSLPGIGLVKACKVMKTARQQDIQLLLKKIPTYLKMNLCVSEDYVEGFVRANNTFLHQLVFDPAHRRMCPLNPYPPEVDSSQLTYAGKYMPDEKAYQIALGNVDIHTHQCIAFFDPSTFQPKSKDKPQYRHQLSIWDPDYRVKSPSSPCKTIQPTADGGHTTHGKARTVHLHLPRPSEAKPEVIKDPGVLEKGAQKQLMSQYQAELEPAGGDITETGDSPMSSQKENVRDVWPPSDNTADAPGVDRSDEEGEELEQENMKDRASPRKGRKRKAPSWLQETDIEATSRDVVGSEGNAARGEARSHSVEISPGHVVPGKSRNVFAVSPSKNSGRFNLDVHALRVRSRYFSPSQTVTSSKTTPSPKKSPSPAAKKVSQQAPPKNRLLSMFENAPVKTKRESHPLGDQPPTKKETSKLGLHKYFCAKSQPSPESASLVRTHVSGPPHDPEVKPERVARPTSSALSQDLPCESKPAAQKSKNSTNIKSRLSAFSWSKSGPLSKHLTRPSSAVNNFTKQPEAEEETNCDVFENETETDSRTRAGPEPGLACVKRAQRVEDSEGSQSADSGVSDLVELQSCSYNQYLQSLAQGAEEGDDDDDGDNPTQTAATDLPCTAVSGDNSVTGTSQVEVNGSQSDSPLEPSASQSDSPLEPSASQSDSPLEASASQSDSPLEPSDSQQNNSPFPSQRLSLTSIDSFCLGSTQEVVDLTDSEWDSQDSVASTVSKSSSLSSAGTPSRCRVSGLSRISSSRGLSKVKVKPGVKKAANNQPAPGQQLISKYW